MQFNPKLEVTRLILVSLNHKEFRRKLKSLPLMPEPKEAYNRWHIERLSQGENEYGNIPLMPNAIIPYGPSLVNEILDDIPIKSNFFYETEEELKQKFHKYVQAVSLWEENGELWRIGQDKLGEEDVLKSFKEYKDLVRSRLIPVWRPVVETLVKDVAEHLQSLQGKLLPDRRRISNSYRDKVIYLSARKLKVGSVSTTILDKLKSLYSGSNWERDLQSLIIRYHILFGSYTGRKQGVNHHATTPSSVMKFLHEELGVSCECFASPFNRYFDNYYSAFGDIDPLFGSRGNFFHTTNIPEGSYQANPPFVLETMEKFVDKVISTCNMGGTYSFTIIVPHWEDANFIQKLKNYTNRYIILEPLEHSYLSGDQFTTSERRSYKQVSPTLVVVVQSRLGSVKWPVTSVLLNDLKELWKKG